VPGAIEFDGLDAAPRHDKVARKCLDLLSGLERTTRPIPFTELEQHGGACDDGRVADPLPYATALELPPEYGEQNGQDDSLQQVDTRGVTAPMVAPDEQELVKADDRAGNRSHYASRHGVGANVRAPQPEVGAL